MSSKTSCKITLSILLSLFASALLLPSPGYAYVIPQSGLDFGDVAINSACEIPLTIENTGTKVIFPHFEFAQSNCDAGHFWVTCPPTEILLPGQQIQIQVHFEATGFGTCATELLVMNGQSVLEQVTVAATGISADKGGTILIGSYDTGVVDRVYKEQAISKLIGSCAVDCENHGEFVSCVAHLTNELKKNEVITEQEWGAIKSAAARSRIP
jgi:hypothetical protein